ncbi:hypothetical protein BDW66DRAFT_4870 [Aspergillus desertorum]
MVFGIGPVGHGYAFRQGQHAGGILVSEHLPSADMRLAIELLGRRLCSLRIVIYHGRLFAPHGSVLPQSKDLVRWRPKDGTVSECNLDKPSHRDNGSYNPRKGRGCLDFTVTVKSRVDLGPNIDVKQAPNCVDSTTTAASRLSH